MNQNLLTETDLEDLTGYTQASKQAECLRHHGIAFVTRRDGKIRTTWAAVSSPAFKPINSSNEPNFGALKRG